MFEQKAIEHANYRVSNQIDEVENAKVAIIQDIYHQFPDSSSSVGKLKAFLEYVALHWNSRPKFILLIGEPNLPDSQEADYCCPTYFEPEINNNDTDLIPIDDKLCKLEQESTCFSAIGRIPAKTESEYGTVLSKIIAFENANGIKSRSIFSIYDDDKWGPTCITYLDFYHAGLSLEKVKPQFLPNTSIQMIESEPDSNYEKPFITDSIIHAVNIGTGFITYFGMGDKNAWAGEHILISDSILGRINSGKFSIFISFTSNSNRFQDRANSLGTKLLFASEKGAVVSIGAPNNGQYLYPLQNIQHSFWSNLGEFRSIGEAFYYSKVRATGTALDKLCLLGDPSLNIAVGSITFEQPDTIYANANQTIQINGNIPASFNGTLRIFRYGLPEHIALTTQCGTEVDHFRSTQIADSTNLNVTAGNFIHSFKIDFAIDSTHPVKLIYYAESNGRKYLGARLILKGSSSPVNKSTLRDRKVPYIFSLYRNEVTIDNISASAQIDVFNVIGRRIRSFPLQQESSLKIPINATGMNIIKVRIDKNVYVHRINVIQGDK